MLDLATLLIHIFAVGSLQLSLFFLLGRRKHHCTLAAYTNGICYSANFYSFVLAPFFFLLSMGLFYVRPLKLPGM